MINPAWIKARAADVRRADVIDPKLYERYNVKRGLRNTDGTGVLVGLSTIGNVHGYVMDEGEKTPVPGALYYRGVNVEDLVRNCQKERRFGFLYVIIHDTHDHFLRLNILTPKILISS